MVFSSFTFILVLLTVALAGNYLLPDKAKNYWLLLVSVIFYAWGAHEFVFVMIGSVLVNYVFARLIDISNKKYVRRLLLFLAVMTNLSVLFYNKYMNFTTSILQQYFGDSIEVTSIVLPIGISFFTFQAMSYVIDVYRKDTKVQKNPYYLGLYISFFPQLVAGPIVRYRTIAEQIEKRKTTLQGFCEGVSRFMFGFAQKVLLSNMMSVIADKAFSTCGSDGARLSVGFAWLGAIAYSMQIFFDFAGYSSMAIGLGKMFGFEFMENFNYPYAAKNVSDFWRRWHISLGQWFRDYVYFPLGGSKVDKRWKLVRNLFVVWMFTGIWHGANYTFIVWGFGYFVLLTFEKLTKLPKRKLPLLVSVVYRIFTLFCVLSGWIVFRAQDLTQALSYWKVMMGMTDNVLVDDKAIRYFMDYWVVLVIGLIFCTPIFQKIKLFLSEKLHAKTAVNFIYDMVAYGLLLLSLSHLAMDGNNPFIYFNF